MDAGNMKEIAAFIGSAVREPATAAAVAADVLELVTKHPAYPQS
jgi:hypothetical protein